MSQQNGAQSKSNRGYKLRGPGRRRSIVTESDFVDEPNEAMLILAHIKNNECLSWRQLAEEYLPNFSHAYVRKVTLGEAKSEAVEIALGIKPKPPETVPVEPCSVCGEAHTVPWCTKEKGDPLPPPAPKPKRAPRPKRHRLHYECGRGDEGATVDAEIRAEMEAAGVSSFTEYVDLLRRKVNDGKTSD